jgi:hypothetical protein
MLFTEKGLYMVRSFETGWQQIYFLSYDGKTLRRLTDGDNWRVAILSVKEGKPAKAFDGTTSEVLYSAQRDSHVRTGVYLATKGSVRTVSNPALSASQVSISPDKKYVVASQAILPLLTRSGSLTWSSLPSPTRWPIRPVPISILRILPSRRSLQ